MIQRKHKTHKLKTWPVYFEPVMRGMKKFEYRKDDRDFRFGDYVLLQEFDTLTGYTGRKVLRQIIYIMRNDKAAPFKIEDGYCILGLEEID